MPTNRITMRQIRQALRLHLEAGLSYAQIARAVGIGKATVGKFMLFARAAGVDWSVAQTLSDEELEARLYLPAVPGASRQLEPDYAWIHQELKRPGVTGQGMAASRNPSGAAAKPFVASDARRRGHACITNAPTATAFGDTLHTPAMLAGVDNAQRFSAKTGVHDR
jgi:hypothetical protein